MMIKYLKIIRHIYIYKDDSLRVIETYYLHMQGVYVDKDRNRSPLGFNSGDGAPTGPVAEARAISTAPPRACRGRSSMKEGGEAEGDGYWVGRRM
jgi:hypothetical protein